ncbi:hypothetical protein [Succinivibrio dextrinosolvens]|uniref:Uncharacterized protein n=2 Tax=Succinivibrio dextrinosolvens TaxID=83771 RepID=A0A662Z9Z1_9GAMM|nr:hypothetical protein [Succinivibrio dextrinosolvens]SFJ96241.1 hypothetical protein SAMN04487865_101022 [Succinivibrio dextrinosolvens]
MIKVSYGSKSLESLNRNKTGKSKKQKTEPEQEKMRTMIHSIIGDLESVIRKGIEQQKAGTKNINMNEVLESVEELFGIKAKEESDNTFSIDGTAFTADELQKAVGVLKGTEGEISAHITESKLLDYINYAHFEIARNVVDKYSKKNLNAQQTELVIKALNSFIEKAQEVHDSIIKRIFEKTQDKYYGYKVTDTAVNDDLATVTGDKVVASNQDLINRITSLFSSVDFSDSAAVSKVINDFKEMVIPAYKEVTEDTEKLEDKLSYDELSLSKTIKNFVNHVSD